MTMIERVARAIYAARRGGWPHATWTDEEIRNSIYFTEARAAIAAMREPTQKMIDAALPAWTRDKIWQAMIDAALGEEKP